MAAKDRPTRFLQLEVRDDHLLAAIAFEGALNDRQLHGIEAELCEPLDAGRAASLALTLGRAGRSASEPVLSAVERRLEESGHAAEASAVSLARALLNRRVPDSVERADRGYRFYDQARGELYVEDPIAAHWHARDRWGPPLRPARESSGVWAGPESELDALSGAALDGRLILVGFQPGLRKVEPVLRLTRSGLSRRADLEDLVRWSEINALGRVESRSGEHAAYETRAGRVTLPAGARLALPLLLELMGRLLKQSRS